MTDIKQYIFTFSNRVAKENDPQLAALGARITELEASGGYTVCSANDKNRELVFLSSGTTTSDVDAGKQSLKQFAPTSSPKCVTRLGPGV